MITFDYDVRNLMVKDIGGLKNVVVSFTFVITAVKNNTARASFFPVELDPPTNNFLQFENLTKQQVVDWALTTVGADQIAALQKGLEGVIDEHIQSEQFGLRLATPPWSN